MESGGVKRAGTRVLITGASGRIGSQTAKILAASGQQLRLMSREPERVPRIAAAEIVRADFDHVASLDSAFAGVNTALVISGSGSPGKRAESHRNAFEAAKRAKVSHVIYLSLMGAAFDSKYPYSRDHFVSEQYLAETGLSHTILRDAFYFGMFVDLFDSNGIIRGPACEGRGAFVARECVARTAAAILLNPPGGCFEVTGRESLSVADIARRLSTLAGRELRFECEDPDAMRERLRRDGLSDEKIDLQVGWFEAIAAGELTRPSDSIRRFTGTPPLSLEQAFSRNPALLEKLR